MITRLFRYSTKSDGSVHHDDTANAAHRVLSSQPGFVARLLARNVDRPGDYIDAVTWSSPEQSKSSSSAAAKDEAVRAWLEHVDEPSVEAWSVKTVAAISRARSALGEPTVGAWMLVRWRMHAGVDVVEHLRTEAAIQHEMFDVLPGYLGGYSLQEIDGRTCMSLSAWTNIRDAKAGVERVLAASGELLEKHMADCEPDATIEYFVPVLAN
jgi:hypothetical protein